MHEMDEHSLDVWASALHTAVAHAMYGGGVAEELQERYGITESLLPAWEDAYASLAKFFRDVSGVRV
jgi:hemoglobin-like flavoprotein